MKNNNIQIIKMEFEKTDSLTYNINGIDLSNAIFYWRKAQEQYLEIPKSYYRIEDISGNTTLIIENELEFEFIERIQICEDVSDTSSQYLEDYKVDPIILKDEYNNLVGVFKKLFEYVKNTSVISDSLMFDVVMPELDAGEVWVKTETGWRGFFVDDVEKNLGIFWEEFNQEKIKVLAELNKISEDSLKNTDAYFKLATENFNIFIGQSKETLIQEAKEELEFFTTEEIKKVTDEGTKQLNLVNVSGTTHLETINTIGQAQKKAVTDEGTKQIELIRETGLEALQEDLSELQKDKLNKGEFLHPNILSAETLMFLSENNLGLKIAPNDFYVESETEKVQGNIYFSNNPNIKGAWEYTGGFEPTEETPYLKELDGDYWKEYSIRKNSEKLENLGKPVVLWEGEAQMNGTTIDLSESFTNFKFIELITTTNKPSITDFGFNSTIVSTSYLSFIMNQQKVELREWGYRSDIMTNGVYNAELCSVRIVDTTRFQTVNLGAAHDKDNTIVKAIGIF